MASSSSSSSDDCRPISNEGHESLQGGLQMILSIFFGSFILFFREAKEGFFFLFFHFFFWAFMQDWGVI